MMGRTRSFFGVELVDGHIIYTFNMGFGPVKIKDNAPKSLADDSFHSVWITRPTKYSQVLVIDNQHKVSSAGLGDNYYFNLDGVFYLGGLKSTIMERMPTVFSSKHGFQGCLSNIEINNEAIDPNKDQLVPSKQVSEGCQESYAVEFDGKTPGLITYKFPADKQPDTKKDQLTAIFLTGLRDCTIIRIDSLRSNDFLEVKLVGGYLEAQYNLGTESI